MAIHPTISKHLDGWIGTFPSPWWVYLRLRLGGHLSPTASGAAVRRIIRDAIREEARQWREAKGIPPLGASWNTQVAAALLEQSLLSAKGEAMAKWIPEEWARPEGR